ncbi:hypothetical protein D9O36_17945 [Zobellia amurskyensis]|uniref:Uncharacterized protein n=1 Tax=Zobellia amurskyensis TaxID=248905 RepID=A0A7X2ZWM3_9FLAO|nr:hypothetical protein [Zobellia amurskyensis]MUH37737.1 hypothetical protein [Zobellia amurskyensis]
MNESEIIDIINSQVKAKVADLSDWREVRWEGGRLYYETRKILNEIQDYNIENQIIYLEKLLECEFTIQDNLPNEAPDITLSFKNWLVKTISQLKIKSIQNISKINFKDTAEIDLTGLKFDQIIINTLNSRIEEIIKGINSKTPLSVIFLSGSTLEGILVGKAKKFPRQFNETKCSPKQKNGKVKILSEWSLNDLINSSFEIGLIDQDVKKFSHYLRDFRNYIHPFEQINAGFNPTMDTATLCWKVLQMAVTQIKENLNKLAGKACA